jgi:hypothetical protein
MNHLELLPNSCQCDPACHAPHGTGVGIALPSIFGVMLYCQFVLSVRAASDARCVGGLYTKLRLPTEPKHEELTRIYVF